MNTDDWLADARTSYDTLALSYAERFRHLLDETPYERAALSLFADQALAGGGGKVADVGCGAGRITVHLRGLGLDPFGIDLSPAMVEVARRDHPGLRFEVGSMTELRLPDASLAGLVAWYSTIHIPDAEIGPVLAQFRRVLRPGAPLLLAFHVGDESQLRTQGVGGHAIRVQVHQRRPERMAAWVEEAGFTVEAQLTTLGSAESPHGAVLFARRRPEVTPGGQPPA